MTLKSIVNLIEATAKAQPTIRTIIPSDPYDLNSTPTAEYGVFSWQHREHVGSTASDLIEYGFRLYYIDRITPERSNVVDVQSDGISTLDNILRTLDAMGVGVGRYTFIPFVQRFTDECAGVYVNVTLSAVTDAVCIDEII